MNKGSVGGWVGVNRRNPRGSTKYEMPTRKNWTKKDTNEQKITRYVGKERFLGSRHAEAADGPAKRKSPRPVVLRREDPNRELRTKCRNCNER